MEKIKYSIIIPVYNLSDYIERTLISLYETGLKSCELIVIDDGSSDDSFHIASEFLKKYNIAGHVLKQKNSGVSKARNVGIDAAQGEYVIFFDGDDLCEKELIELLDDNYVSCADMFVWRFNIVEKNKKRVSQSEFERDKSSNCDFLKQLLCGVSRIRIGSFAIKRNVLIDNDLRFTEGCAICEDIEFMYKCVLMSGNVYFINNPLYNYIKREGSAANIYDMRRFQAPFAVKRIYDFAVRKCENNLDEFISDILKNGLLITHAMYSFDSCCRYIKGLKQYKEFIRNYLDQYGDVEALIRDAISDMKYEPTFFSRKRLKLFMFSRRLYALYMCIK